MKSKTKNITKVTKQLEACRVDAIEDVITLADNYRSENTICNDTDILDHGSEYHRFAEILAKIDAAKSEKRIRKIMKKHFPNLPRG